MKFIINILLSISLLFGASKSSSNIKTVLKDNLNGIKRFEYKIVSPKNVDINKIKIDEERELKIEKGYAYLPVIFNPKKNAQNGIITLKLKLYKDVAVSVNDIKRKETITKYDYKIEEREISSLRGKPIDLNKNFTHLRAKRNIKHGTIISENMFEKIPDVKRGTRVNAIFQKGIVNVSFGATARTEGKVGDIIKIKRNDNKIFKAEIINSKQVRIIE